MSVLQDTAMMQVKSKKNPKRTVRENQYGTGVNHDWMASASSTRLRSGSGGSRTTTTSDSGDAGYSPMVLSQQSSSFSSSSSQQQQQHLMSSTSTSGSSSRLHAPQYSSPSLNQSTSFNSGSPSPHFPPSSSTTLPNSISAASADLQVAPIVSRISERDADAIAEYIKRNRSGSSGTQYSADSKGSGSSTANMGNGNIGSNGGVSTLPTINGSNSHLPLTPSPSNPPPTLATRRLLRPSASTSQLQSPPLPIVTNPNSEVPPSNGALPRMRAGTQPTTIRPVPVPSQSQSIVTSPTESTFSVAGRASVERGTSGRRAGTTPSFSSNSIVGGRRPSEPQGDFTGPPSDYAIFPDPPSKIPVGVESATPPPPPSATTKPLGRRAGFALLTKPLPGIEPRSHRDRDHRRGGSASDVRG